MLLVVLVLEAFPTGVFELKDEYETQTLLSICPSLPGGRNTLRLSILRHRPARDLDAAGLEPLDDINIAKRALLVFLFNKLLDPLNNTTTSLHGAVRLLGTTGEEELHLVDPGGALNILTTDRATDSRDVNADDVSDLDHFERPEARDPVAEETFLNLDDLSSDALKRRLTLADRRNEPLRTLEPLLDELLHLGILARPLVEVAIVVTDAKTR